MNVKIHLKRNNLEEALNYIKESGADGRIYREGEVGEALCLLESLGCIKSSYAGESGVDLAIGGSEATRDLLFGSHMTKFTYLKELPKKIWK